MKKLISIAVLLLCASALGQSNSVYNASTYAYTTQVRSGNTSTGASSVIADPTAFAQGIPFLPYNLNASITINRNAATAETVTPSALAQCFPNSLTCTLSATFTYKHIAGESIQSGTFGLQEALNVAIAAGSGTVLLDATWGGPSGSSLITAAKGNANVMIQDNRNPSGAVFYQWNGSAYATTGGTGAVSSVFGRTGAVTANTGDYTCAQVTNCGQGVPSLNGQIGAQSILAGANITVTPNGTNGVTIAAAGGAGSGAVASANLGQAAGYPAAGTTVSGLKAYYLNSSMTLAQINTIFTEADANTEVYVLPGVPQYAWSNPNGADVRDYRKGADYLYPARYGIVCDAQHFFLTITSGSNQVATNADLINVGATFVIGQQTGFGYQAIQNVWMPVSTSFTFPNMTLSGNAPFGYTGWVTTGTDNTAAFNAAFADATYVFPFRLPASCYAMTQTTTWSGTPIQGMQMNSGGILGVPGQDIIQAVGGAADADGAGLKDVGLYLDTSIDPTLGYRAWNQAGTSYTTVAPIYRPTLNNTPDANHPLNDQWGTGLTNGVANTTAGSAVICVATALGRTPANGSMILFPYLLSTELFETTVLNQTGTGCGTGFTGVTLNANVPTGGTATQAYYETGTAFETGETSLSTSITYPQTITVSLPNAPDPNGTTAPLGHFIIGNNSVRFEADYMGNNYSPTPGSGTFILQRGPATISGALTAGAYWVIPANPCAAAFETPPPVYPNINGGSSETPAGAVDIPGGCVGNAAISFPEPNGTTPSTGTVNAFFERLFFSHTANSLAQGNNGAAFYMQGNTAGYSDLLDSFKISGLTYGIVQGPASIHNWGIASVGPTAAGNTISNCQIFAAFPIVLSDFSQGKVDRCDTYTSMINPFNGSVQGAATGIAASYTTNEQTGAAVTSCFEFGLFNWNSENENGSPNVVVFPYSYINCSNYNLLADNFEGPYQFFAGSNGLIQDTQLAVPVINTGTNNKFENVFGITASYMTNNWADSTAQFFNWGAMSSCSGSFGGASIMGHCGVGFMQEWNGHDMFATTTGNDNGGNVENVLAGTIEPYERQGMGPVQYDSTEPYWGKFTTCTLGSGAECIMEQFDSFNGYIYIGNHNRIAPSAYTLEMNVKSPAGANSAFVFFGAQDSGTGQCASAGQFSHIQFTTTSSWTHKSIPVTFAGRQGCILQLQFDNGASNDTFEFGEMNFVPQIQSTTITPPSDSIYHTSCTVPGRNYGVSATGYSYVCVAGTIDRSGPYN